MSKGLILSKICHNIEPFLQPDPKKNPDGDCFACATFAALRWLYPDANLTFDDVWNTYVLKQDNSDGTSFEYLGNSWLSYPKVFKNIVRQLKLKDFKWKKNHSYPTFKNWGCDLANWNRDKYQYNAYWAKLKSDIQDGGIVFISVNMEGEGPWKNGRWNETDHVILIDGVRERRVPLDHVVQGATRIDLEVHTVCSRKGARWITVYDLLDLHGAGAWYTFRRIVKNG